MRMMVVLPAPFGPRNLNTLAAPDREADPIQCPGHAIDLDEAARLDRQTFPGHPFLPPPPTKPAPPGSNRSSGEASAPATSTARSPPPG